MSCSFSFFVRVHTTFRVFEVRACWTGNFNRGGQERRLREAAPVCCGRLDLDQANETQVTKDLEGFEKPNGLYKDA